MCKTKKESSIIYKCKKHKQLICQHYEVLQILRSTYWKSAQYWKTRDLVEVAIIDEGCGIRNSLSEDDFYVNEIDSDLDALYLSVKRGVSCTFDGNEDEEIFKGQENYWKNSGNGLYEVSDLCIKSGGNFAIASGNSAIVMSVTNTCLDY